MNNYSLSELINVCISNNFMEQQAYKMSKEIQNNSFYKVVRAEDSEGNDLKLRLHDEQWNGKDFITKIILEDKKGNYYSVKPDYNGLRFAKGEINYKEYYKTMRKENFKGYGYFFVSIVFITLMFSLIRFLT